MPTDVTRPDAPLSVSEHRALADAEAVIARSLGTFQEVGRALLTIRAGRLYRSTHPTFETYCRDRWDMSRQRGYQLVDAAETTACLPSPHPTAESQVRPLASLPLGERPPAWADAVKNAGGKVPTARAFREVVNRRAGKDEAPKPKRARGWPKFSGFALYREDGRPVLAYKLDK